MKVYKGICLACVILAGTSAMADHLSVSTNAMSFKYSPANGQPSEEANYLYGFTAKYAHNIFGSKATTDQGAIFANVSVYNGNSNNINLTPPATAGSSSIKNQIVNTKVGYRQYKNLTSVTLSTQLALGYRYWDRKPSSSQDEKYQWTYGDIKIGLDSHLTKKDDLGLTASYDLAINPTMKASANDYTLGNTYGYAFSVPYTHSFTAHLSMQISYTYQQWHISASNTYVPRSTTTQSIGSIGLIYNY